VKTHEGYAKKATKNDCFWLLRQIKSVTLRFNKSNNGFLSLLEAQNSFLSCKQLIGQSVIDFPDCLVGWAKNIETHGRTVVVNYELIPRMTMLATRVAPNAQGTGTQAYYNCCCTDS
jgi:hypothetical protein